MAEPKAITAGGNGSIASQAQHDPHDGPSIGCDQPIERLEFVAHNELVLTGWATSPHGISGVVVQIEDRLLNAAYGLDTPWLTAEAGDALSGRAGFELRIDTSAWNPGPREMTIAAFDQTGGRTELAGRVEILPFEAPRYSPEEIKRAIEAGETAMWLESPAIVEGPCEVQGSLEVRGWAYAKGGLESVRVMIDGNSISALRPIVRPDLLEELGPEVAGEAGFVLTFDPSECPPGLHELTVVAVGPDGRGVGLSGEVVCRAEAREGPPEPEGPADIEWIEDRSAPRERSDAADRYRPTEHAGSLFEAKHQLRYRWAAPLAQGRTVLDAGCGFGWGTAMLAQAGAERVFGVDSSAEALAEARRQTEGLAVELERGDLVALPFEDGSFDLIACFGAIDRARDREQALEELRRVLRPEGVLLISAERRRATNAEAGAAGSPTPHELEQSLRGRFANVRLHRQRAHLASTVLDDETETAGDGEAELDVDVRDLAEMRPGGEDHTIAVAGDGPLPELGRLALLTSPRAIRRVHDSAGTWEDRALHAEAEAAATRVQVNLARMHQEASVRVLREHEAELAEQEPRLAEQNERLTEQDERIWAQHERIEQLQEEVERQHEQVEQRDALIDSQAATLGARNAELRVTAERLRRAEAEAAAWQGSVSVQITRPLRAIARAVRRMRNAVPRRPGS